MDFAADFTAIDFETASRRTDSACQLAAVRVREGRIVNEAMWMIRPRPLYFSPMNIQIHGIRPADVRDAPEFGDLWPEVLDTFGDDCLVAHNAGFDIGVLLACLRTHRLQVPEIQYTCTRSIARKAWPSRPRFGLKPLAQWLGIRFQHHDALEDSIACAKLLLAAGIDAEATSLEDLERKLRIKRGSAGEWGIKRPGSRSARRKPRRADPPQRQVGLPFHWPGQEKRVKETSSEYEFGSHEMQRLLIRADFIRPLSGQRVVLAGRFRKLGDDEVKTLTLRLGGDCDEHVTDRTDMVVVGAPHAEGSEAPQNVAQLRQNAERLRASGKAVKILNEIEYLRHCQELLVGSAGARSQ